MGPSCAGPSPASAEGDRRGADPLDLGLYLDGLLPESQSRVVELHLVQCEACRLRLCELRDLKAALEDRALWRARGRDDSGLGVGTSCLSAAEMLLALEGKSTPRAQSHLSSCEVCTSDVMAIEESTEEHAAGKLARPEPELIEVLRSVGRPGSTEGLDDGEDAFAPIIIMPQVAAPADAPAANSKRISKRLAPRHPSKRVTSQSIRTARSRNVTFAGGVFTFAAAAAAAVIVALLCSQSGPTTGDSTPAPEVAQKKPVVFAPRTTPPAPRETVRPKAPAPIETPDSTVDERVDPPEPQSPFEPGPVAEVPGPAETPSPATQSKPAQRPTSPSEPAVSGKPAIAAEVAKGPLPLDAPVSDDGGRIELDLTRLSGQVAIKTAKPDKTTDGSRATGGSTAVQWARLAKKEGKVALKPGDRIRSTGGAFLSLDEGTYELSLAPKSELVVRGAASGPTLGLTDGRVLCEVEKLPADKHLIVATNSADFECTGTVFSVAADSQKAFCAVEEGTVLCRAPVGDARPVGAGFAVTVARGEAPSAVKPAPADANAWARSVRPEREIVYFANFDRGDIAGFQGSLTAEDAFRGVGRSLVFEPVDDNKFWGLAARAPKGKVKNWKPTLDMRISFSVWLDKESHVLMQVMNERQNKYFKRDFGVQPGHKWVTLTVPVMDLETYYDPGKSPMREQDLVSEMEIFTGDPGDKWRALLDDVTVYRKRYR